MQFVVQKGQSSASAGVLASRLGQLIYPARQHNGPQDNPLHNPDQLQFPQPSFDQPNGYTPPAVNTYFATLDKNDECDHLAEKGALFDLKSTRKWSTPNYLQYTNQASIPHICWTIAHHLARADAPLLMPLGGCFTMIEPLIKYGKGVKSFAAIPSDPLIVISNQDPLRLRSTDVVHRVSVPVWSHGGRKLIDEKDFHQVLDAFKPDVATSLIDESLPDGCSVKQTLKYTEKAITYLQRNAIHISTKASGERNDKPNLSLEKEDDMPKPTITIEKSSPQLFASIPFSNDVQAVNSAVKKILELDNQVCGYSFCNLIAPKDQIDLNLEQSLKQVLEKLPIGKPRLLLGSFSPEMIVRLTQLGIDLFDNSYCTEMTDKHQALLLRSDFLHTTSGDEGLKPEVPCETLELESKELFETDFEVIDSDCDCYACKNKFSRSYICHLANAKEMLAKVLLQFHNIHTYSRLFELIRASHV